MIWALLEKFHGHLAVLAVAACFHPPLILRRARRTSRGVRLSGYAASALMVSSIALGWFIYPEYRATLRARIYQANPSFGHAFEVKEHFGTYAVALAVAGAIAMWLSRRPDGQPLVPLIRKLYLAAAVLSAIAAGLGVAIASFAGFHSAH